MKSKREKETLILVLLLFIAACYAFYAYLLSPKMSEAEELKTQVETEDGLIRSYYSAIQQYPQRMEEFLQVKEQGNTLSDKFFVDTQQEDYLNILDGVLRGNRLALESAASMEHDWLDMLTNGIYRCESPYAAYISEGLEGEDKQLAIEEVQQSAQGESDGDESYDTPVTEQMTIQLDVNGQYRNLKAFISALQKLNQQVVCSSLDMDVVDGNGGGASASASANPSVSATVQLQFVRLSDLICREPNDSIEDFPTEFSMPQDFISGNYRKLLPFF